MPDSLIQVTPQILLFPHDQDPARFLPNIGVIIAGQRTVLIDSGNSPRHARRVLLALDAAHLPPPSYLIYTHSHWEQVFGGQVFGAPAVAHELCRKQLAEWSAKPWSNTYIGEEIQRNPAREPLLRGMQRAVEEWRHFRIHVPEISFSKRLRLYLEGVTLELEHVAGPHTPDSIIVRVPEARAMFIGDCYLPPPLQVRAPGESVDGAVVASLLHPDYDWYIDSYGPPRSREAFTQLASNTPLGVNGTG